MKHNVKGEHPDTKKNQRRFLNKKVLVAHALPNDKKCLCGALRKLLNCNGNVVESEEGAVMQLQGDQRDFCKKWLLEQEIVSRNEADRIVVHGF